MADKEEKKERRLKPKSETIRERSDRQLKQSPVDSAPKQRSKVVRGLAKVFRPFRWLGRHLIPKYFRQAFVELKLVTWPSRRETRQLTTAVIIFAVIFGAMVTAVDFGLDKVFKRVFLK